VFCFSDDLNVDLDRGSSLTCYFLDFFLFCHNCCCSNGHSIDFKFNVCDAYHPRFARSEFSLIEIAIYRL
jgi:hypothetical protein